MAKVIRYAAMDKRGNCIASGRTIESVESAACQAHQRTGKGYILDYHKLRYAVAGSYPVARHLWHQNWHQVGDMIRADRAADEHCLRHINDHHPGCPEVQ